MLAVYPHATDAQALQAAQDIFRDSAFAWPTWAWARLQSAKGKGARTCTTSITARRRQPNGAWHADEIPLRVPQPGQGLRRPRRAGRAARARRTLRCRSS